jgi:hypothetical protein
MKRLLLLAMMALLAFSALPGAAAELSGDDGIAKDIKQLPDGSYVLHRGERPFLSHEKQKSQIEEDADTYAARLGKSAEKIAMEEHSRELNQFYTAYSWDYKFRLVDRPGSAPAAAAPVIATTIVPAGEPAAKGQTTATAAPAAPPAETRARTVDELYDQLIKLDELRKRGILTDDEFEAQKKKLLDAD